MTKAEAREQAKWQLEKYVNSITERSKGANMFVCPLCHSGKKKNGTGAFSITDNSKWHCFSCGKGGDIFDLIGEMYNLTDYNDQERKACELLSIDVDGVTPSKKTTTTSTQKPAPTATPEAKEQPQVKEVDYTEFYKQANQNLNQTSYHRGISLEVLNRFNVGYVESWINPKAPKKPATPRLIIPTSKTSYLARYASDDAPEDLRIRKVGNVHIFNANELEKAQFNATDTTPVFVTEGEIDAMSVIEVGAKAVGLGSKSNTDIFLNFIKGLKHVPTLILALDNDKDGMEATEKLKTGLDALNLTYYQYNIAGEEKDENGALLSDRAGFTARVKEAVEIEAEVRRAKIEAYKLESAGGQVNNFLRGISESANTPCISTGFKKLDEIMDGGLYEGLYVIGAKSGAGKTSFILQMADQIARTGKNVLYFTLEMSKYELMAKSISRHTLEIVEREELPAMYSKTARGISSGARYAGYDQTQKDVINRACEAYREYANNIWFTEGIGNIGVVQIAQKLKEHINMTGNTPIVIVDYLQIMAVIDQRATDKQNMDRAILELKRISRDYKTTIFVVSSLNRASYQNDISMEAFKESGAIEYSSDVLIGLQTKKDGANSKDLKEMELHILKNRYGLTTGNRDNDENPISLRFYPRYNLFEEA